MGLKKWSKRARSKTSNYFRRVESNLENTWERYKTPIMQLGATALAAIPGVGIPLSMAANAAIAAGTQAYEARKAEKQAKRMGKNMFSAPKRNPFSASRGAGEGSVDFTASSEGPGIMSRGG